jgi:predicted site-specific integrase-resolvase
MSALSETTLAPPPAPRRRWIGTTRAKRLLGVGSENTVKAWVRYGYLRGRVLPNGRTQVRLDDVLRLQGTHM